MANYIFKINDFCNKIFFYIFPLTLILIIVLCSLWNVYIIRKIRFYRKKYLNAIAESKDDPYDNYKSLAVSYKTEYIKYILLLVINSSEMIGAIGYGFGAIITYVLWSVDKNVEYPNTFENSNCTGELSLVSDIEINILTEVPIGRISITIGQIAFLCSLGFGIYLIHYLREKEYDRESNFKYFGVITIVFAFVIFLTGSVLQFKIFEIIFGPFILVIYFCIWVKHIKIFYKILKDRVIKLKVRQSHETKVRRAMESMYQFGIIMSLNGTAFACFLLSEIIEAIFFSISIGIFYGPCIFSYVYRTAAYEPWLRGPEHFQTLILAGTLISIILKLLIVFAQGIILIHYSLGTILFFWEACLIDIKTRFGFGVRTRYTPSLFNPLLFTHQENK